MSQSNCSSENVDVANGAFCIRALRRKRCFHERRLDIWWATVWQPRHISLREPPRASASLREPPRIPFLKNKKKCFFYILPWRFARLAEARGGWKMRRPGWLTEVRGGSRRLAEAENARPQPQPKRMPHVPRVDLKAASPMVALTPSITRTRMMTTVRLCVSKPTTPRRAFDLWLQASSSTIHFRASIKHNQKKHPQTRVLLNERDRVCKFTTWIWGARCKSH